MRPVISQCNCMNCVARRNSPPVQPNSPAVLDSDAHQFAIEYAKLSVNGKRHARAMIAGLVRLEAGAA